MNLISPETRMMGLPYGEEISIVGRTMWTQSTSVTDRQTDGQNYDRKDRERIASHGKNCYCYYYKYATTTSTNTDRSSWCAVAGRQHQCRSVRRR